jgi:septal ring factor EnvC (AmiA/AmiB activator)
MRLRRPGLALLALLLAGAAPAGDTDPLGRKIAEVEARIRKLREEARLRALEAEASRAWMDELSPQIQRLDLQIEEARQELLLSELELTRNNEALQTLLDSASRLEQSLGLRRSYLRARLGAVYRQGRSTALRLLLRSETPQRLLRHVRYFSRLASLDRLRIGQLRSQTQALQALRRTHRSLGARLLALRQEADRRRAELDSARRDKRLLLDRLTSHRKGFLQQNRELLAASRRLDRTLERLERQRAQDPAVPFEAFRGRLRWPVEGRLVSGFGRRRHEKYDAWTVQNGIVLAPEEGQPVKAVFRGRVRYAGRFHGYGKIVLLEHPGGYLTLYAHLGTVEVAEGQQLVEETILGTVGDTGVASEPTLYFELRQGLRPQNPLKWLRPLPRKSRSPQ